MHNYNSLEVSKVEQQGLLEENGMKAVSHGETGLPNNMWGPKGDPIHQATVDRLLDIAEEEFPDMVIHRESPLPEDLGIGRNPDVWVEDPATGNVLKVYEAARYENGTLVPRELLKQKQYNGARIPSHFEEVR